MTTADAPTLELPTGSRTAATTPEGWPTYGESTESADADSSARETAPDDGAGERSLPTTTPEGWPFPTDATGAPDDDASGRSAAPTTTTDPSTGVTTTTDPERGTTTTVDPTTGASLTTRTSAPDDSGSASDDDDTSAPDTTDADPTSTEARSGRPSRLGVGRRGRGLGRRRVGVRLGRGGLGVRGRRVGHRDAAPDGHAGPGVVGLVGRLGRVVGDLVPRQHAGHGRRRPDHPQLGDRRPDLARTHRGRPGRTARSSGSSSSELAARQLEQLDGSSSDRTSTSAAEVEPQMVIPTTSPMDPRFWAWLTDTVTRSTSPPPPQGG